MDDTVFGGSYAAQDSFRPLVKFLGSASMRHGASLIISNYFSLKLHLIISPLVQIVGGAGCEQDSDHKAGESADLKLDLKVGFFADSDFLKSLCVVSFPDATAS